jgi:hypothetical protein
VIQTEKVRELVQVTGLEGKMNPFKGVNEGVIVGFY